MPYVLAGFTHQYQDFWLSRNTVIPNENLQKQIFPFIEQLFPYNSDWEQWIQNTMMDRPEHTDRNDMDISYPAEMFPAMRMMLILAHLRKVVQQDAVVMMESTGDSRCIYSRHHIFQENVFTNNQALIDFSRELRARMLDAKSSFHDSLRANAPILDERMQSMEANISSLRSEVRDSFASVIHAVDIDTEATMEAQSKQDSLMRSMKEIIQSCERILSHMERDVSVAREHQLQIRSVQQAESRIQQVAGVQELDNRDAVYAGLSARLEHDNAQTGEDSGINRRPFGSRTKATYCATSLSH